MTKTVVLAGTLDTKGQDFAFVRDLIEAKGLETLVVDSLWGPYPAALRRDTITS